MEPLSADDPRTVGEFALRARLGAGGMGQVYLGFSPAGRAVAIKVVHSALLNDREFRERFGREVAAARAVSGMYTAPVVAAGLDDNPPWFATAFVPGPSLADVVSAHGPLPEAAVWRLAAGLTEALRAVHACGLVHRDLKPANVLLAADGPHVIDFGISRAFEGTSLTQTGMVVGTPGYMSPEQAEGQQAGPQSDVFSLGCVLAFAATGTPVFGSGSAASVLYRVVRGEPDLGAVPPRLRAVIEACLVKDPAERVPLASLTSMISASGPATVATLGAFWPAPLDAVIAASQSYPTPAQVGPDASGSAGDSAAAPPAFALSGQVPAAMQASGAQPGAPSAAASQPQASQPALSFPPTATALGGTPSPASAPPAPAPAQPAAAPGFAGQAGMMADGYLQAATRSMVAGNPLAPSYPGQPATPQSYLSPGAAPATPAPPAAGDYPSTQRASWPSQPGGAAQPATPRQQPAAPGAGYGTPPGQYGTPPGQYGGQYPPIGQYGTPAGQYGGQYPPIGQYGTPPGSYPQAGQYGAADPLAQYTPGLRRPTKAEVPSPVLTAVRLMWTGLVFSALELIFAVATVGKYNDDVTATRAKIALFDHASLAYRAGSAVIKNAQDRAAVVGTFGLAASVIALIAWTWLAIATRGGRGWARVAGTVLFGVNSIGTLFLLVGSTGDPAVKTFASIVWVISLATTILLWGNQASAFFTAWRSHSPSRG